MKKTSVLLMSAAVLGTIAMTTPQAPVQAASSSTTAQTSTTKITAGPNGAQIFSAPANTAATSRIVTAGSHWKTFKSVQNSDGTWYNLGGNQWVKGSEIDTTNTYVAKDVSTSKPDTVKTSTTKLKATVTAEPNGAQIFTAPSTSKSTSRIVSAGSHWKAFTSVKNSEGTWYNLGGNQWVMASAIDTTNTYVAKDVTTSKPDAVKTSTTKLKATVTAGPNGAMIYSAASNSKSTGRIVSAGSHWKTFASVKNSEGTWYNLGGNQWVDAHEVDTTNTYVAVEFTGTTGIAKVSYMSGYSIPVWNSYRGGTQIAGKRLQNGSTWKVFNTARYNGNTWYNLGGNQWVDAHYISFSK